MSFKSYMINISCNNYICCKRPEYQIYNAYLMYTCLHVLYIANPQNIYYDTFSTSKILIYIYSIVCISKLFSIYCKYVIN